MWEPGMGLGFGSIPDLSNRMLTRLAGVGWPLVKNFHERLSLSILLRLRGEEENFASICWVVAPRQMSPAFCSRLEQTPLAFSLSPSPSPFLRRPLTHALSLLSTSLSPSSSSSSPSPSHPLLWEEEWDPHYSSGPVMFASHWTSVWTLNGFSLNPTWV